MKNYSAIVCVSVLALALSACGGGDAPVAEDPSLQPTNDQVADGSSASTNADASDAPVIKQAPFGNAPLVTSPVNGKVRSLPSLTPSASVESRINSTSSGKSDPFAGRVISVRPIPPDPEDVVASFPLAGNGDSPASEAGQALAGGETNGTNRGGSGAGRGVSSNTGRPSGGSNSGGRGAGVNNNGSTGGNGDATVSGSGSAGGGSATLPDLAARPPVPDPALARAVEVTGIILIGSKYQAIVKAPNEPTSRYVTAGQRLAGGRVLVKRIENQGSEPVVVLEEDGVEVIRSIDEPGQGPAGESTAVLPELAPAS